ncbi:hypothetical protein [Pseudomonas nicosulfuronedens]
MTFRYLLIPMLLGCTTLAGCNDPERPATLAAAPIHRNWLSVPALPFVQDAVLSLAPKLENGLNSELMNQLCGLARNELAQDQVNTFLRDHQIDVGQQGPLALLVNGDKAGQATLCAAHLASGAFSTVDLEPFIQQPAAEAVAEQSTVGQTSKIDPASAALLLSVKLAVARANADVFALIASELQRRPGLPPVEVREQAQQLFSRLAPTYLARIRSSLSEPGTTFQLRQLSKGRLVFTSSDGASFELKSGQLTLRQDGATSFGNGRLLGLSRVLQVRYFDEDVEALMTSPASESKVR